VYSALRQRSRAAFPRGSGRERRYDSLPGYLDLPFVSPFKFQTHFGTQLLSHLPPKKHPLSALPKVSIVLPRSGIETAFRGGAAGGGYAIQLFFRQQASTHTAEHSVFLTICHLFLLCSVPVCERILIPLMFFRLSLWPEFGSECRVAFIFIFLPLYYDMF
jgi:hypothetical protein